MKPLLPLLILLLMAGNAFAGVGVRCERGNGGLVYAVTCCGNDGNYYGLASNKDYPQCPDSKGKCKEERDTEKQIKLEDKFSDEAAKKVCEARGPKKAFKGYPILIAYNSCPETFMPCITYTENGKYYKPK